MISEEIQLIKQNIYDLLHNTRISKKAYLIILIGLFFTYFVGNAIINTLSIQLIEMYYLRVNVNIRMYNFDDVQCTVIPSVAYGFVTGMNLQLC